MEVRRKQSGDEGETETGTKDSQVEKGKKKESGDKGRNKVEIKKLLEIQGGQRVEMNEATVVNNNNT